MDIREAGAALTSSQDKFGGLFVSLQGPLTTHIGGAFPHNAHILLPLFAGLSISPVRNDSLISDTHPSNP